jgi:hypothetical protein
MTLTLISHGWPMSTRARPACQDSPVCLQAHLPRSRGGIGLSRSSHRSRTDRCPEHSRLGHGRRVNLMAEDNAARAISLRRILRAYA